MEARLNLALAVGRPATVVQRAEEPNAAEQGEEAVETAEAAVENGANVWPDESAETAFLSEQGKPDGMAVAVTGTKAEAKEEQREPNTPLPKLEELVKRVPAGTREMLDDLFRAKFSSVRRVPKKNLKE